MARPALLPLLLLLLLEAPGMLVEAVTKEGVVEGTQHRASGAQAGTISSCLPHLQLACYSYPLLPTADYSLPSGRYRPRLPHLRLACLRAVVREDGGRRRVV